MTTLKDAFEWIRQHGEPVVKTIGNLPYASRGVERIKPPSAPPLGINSLDGLVEFSVNMEIGHDSTTFHVNSWTRVELIGSLNELEMIRHTYAIARPFERSSFRFGHYLTIENFIVDAQSLFADDGDKEKLINAVSGISSSDVLTSEDDGISQSVVTKNKLSRLEPTKMDPIVNLAPFRTFPEIQQPVSPFLLRFKRLEKELPLVALFEADGGAWKLDAMRSIAEYLTSRTKLDVIA